MPIVGPQALHFVQGSESLGFMTLGKLQSNVKDIDYWRRKGKGPTLPKGTEKPS